MEIKKTTALPTGIEVLRYFYALTALLSALHLVFLSRHTDILWFNSRLSEQNSSYVTLILMLVPLLLYFGFKYHNLFFWFIAFAYHFLFSLNSLLGAIFSVWNNCPIKPIIRITGSNVTIPSLMSDTRLRLLMVFNLNLFMGVIILWYLWRKRGYFKRMKRKGSVG